MKQTKILVLLCTALIAASQADCSWADDEAEASHDANIVALKQESLDHISMKIEPAELQNLDMKLTVTGRLSVDMNKTARITPTLEGRLIRVAPDLNDHVNAGDVVAVMESPELAGRELQIKSPINGTVISRASTIGELIEKGKEILTISDLSALWAIAEVKERDIAAIKVGQPVTFRVLSYPDREFRGRVALLGNQVEEDTRTLEVRIIVDNQIGFLKPGMFADISIVTTILQDALVIPDSALQTDEDSQVVFVALGENRFEKRAIRTGYEQGGMVQITTGLKAGEKVVTEGSFIMKSELLKGELGEE